MKSAFSSYYRPSNGEFAILWRTCFFAFDANVLLDFYRYSPDTQKSLFRILDRLKNRVWIPHQAALEFHKNRLKVISDMQKPYQTAKKIVGDIIGRAGEEFAKLPAKHPYIKVEDIRAQFEQAQTSIFKTLDDFASKHPNLLDSPDEDDIRDHITKLFEGRVGAPYTPDKRQEIYAEAKKRFEGKVPPGYMDLKEKEVPDAYGDVVLWLQLLDEAKRIEKPCIFVTGDNKEDWWLIQSGRTIGPRPELRDEFLDCTNNNFYLYSPEQFIRYTEEFLDIKSQQKIIDEVRDVSSERQSHTDELRKLILRRAMIRHRAQRLENAIAQKIASGDATLPQFDHLMSLQIKLGGFLDRIKALNVKGILNENGPSIAGSILDQYKQQLAILESKWRCASGTLLSIAPDRKLTT